MVSRGSSEPHRQSQLAGAMVREKNVREKSEIGIGLCGERGDGFAPTPALIWISESIRIELEPTLATEPQTDGQCDNSH